jgi:AGCS family alanine or glycine:cation symporter
VLTLALVLWGSLQDVTTVFAFADITMEFRAVVNLTAVALLIKVGLRIIDDFDAQERAGIEHPVFDPGKFADLNIDREAQALDPAAAAPAQASPALT